MGYGVPIFDYTGSAVAGMSIGGFLHNFPEERDEYLVKKICESAKEISNAMGFKYRN